METNVLEDMIASLTNENITLKSELIRLQRPKTAVTDFLRPKEVQIQLDMSRTTLDRLLSGGQLERVKIGGKVYISRKSVDNYMKNV